jgi:hypothetical protein
MATINVQPHRGPRAKGPETLGDQAITDIVYGRTLTDARKVLAKRFGVAERRIDEIWREYYGGTTLKHAKNGLKKQPPCAQRDVPQVVPRNSVQVLPDGTRILKTVRGTYTLKKPASAAGGEPRTAEIVDKIAAGEPELELEAVGTGAPADISDNDAAKIVAGQVLAGNNNPELLAVLDRLAELGENMSRTTELLVKQAREKARNKRLGAAIVPKQKNSARDIERSYDLGKSGYDDASSESDSAAEYDDETSYESSDGGLDNVEYVDAPSWAPPSRASSVLDKQRIRFRDEDSEAMDHDDGLLERTTGRKGRAEPVYSAVARRPVRAAGQANTSGTSGSRQQVQPTQRDTRERPVQQNSSNYGSQFSAGPRERIQANSAGPQGFGQDQWRAGLKRPP